MLKRGFESPLLALLTLISADALVDGSACQDRLDLHQIIICCFPSILFYLCCVENKPISIKIRRTASWPKNKGGPQ
jgi:hypothetical protein